MTSLALSFNDVQFDIVDRDNQPWLRVHQIGVALGYSRPDAANKIYQNNSDEFTENMTALVELDTTGGKQKVRIFSLRGCHLLAMFARTAIAKQFRKWVLDILDKETRSTTEPNDFIAQTLSQISKGNKKLYMSMYNGLIRHFSVGRISDIPASDCAKAIEVMRVYANEWEIKNGGRPAQKLNDGYNFFVVKDGVAIYQKVISPDMSRLTPQILASQTVLLEHIRQVVGEFVGKQALPAPKPVLTADFSKESVFDHKRQYQRHLLSLDVFYDGYGWEGNPLRRLFALLKQAKKDGTTIVVNDIEGAELVFSVTESLARQYKQSLDELSRHAANASDRGCYLPLQGC
ncbi:MAG: BRO family protein [Agitococcus sp.]|nr:BRO family protein [Agitococcus sp.]